MFPVSDDSLSILECLKREALKLNIKTILHAKVLKIQKPDKFIISFNVIKVITPFLSYLYHIIQTIYLLKYSKKDIIDVLIKLIRNKVECDI